MLCKASARRRRSQQTEYPFLFVVDIDDMQQHWPICIWHCVRGASAGGGKSYGSFAGRYDFPHERRIPIVGCTRSKEILSLNSMRKISVALVENERFFNSTLRHPVTMYIHICTVPCKLAWM